MDRRAILKFAGFSAVAATLGDRRSLAQSLKAARSNARFNQAEFLPGCNKVASVAAQAGREIDRDDRTFGLYAEATGKIVYTGRLLILPSTQPPATASVRTPSQRGRSPAAIWSSRADEASIPDPQRCLR